MNTEVRQLAALARQLLLAGGNLQSSGGQERIAPAKLKAGLEKHLASLAGSQPVVPEAAAAQILQAAGNALLKAAEGKPDDITDTERAGLEVIVQVTGRPALRYANGHVQPPTTSISENERWHVFVVTSRKKIDAVSASVARLDLVAPGEDPITLGTGWRLGSNLLVTNRHVAELLAADTTRAPAKWQLDSSRQWLADFSATDGSSGESRFAIASLDYCSEDEVDAAIVTLRPAAAAFPAALDIDFDAAAIGSVSAAGSFAGEDIYVVGHPVYREPTDEVNQVFGDADGRKRCSPGKATAIRVDYPVFDHDCSTLGGNSGSAVLNVGTHRAVGLHFGGYADSLGSPLGDANVAVAFAKLGKHRLGEILKNGHL